MDSIKQQIALAEQALDMTDMVVGIDLIGDEALYPTTDEHLELLLASQKKIGKDRFKLFLSAG